ncbi:MAG: MATE family efflux transporter [Firmicutes bacterium]|nr:MATE family efflux transporter [Bacillota bacterium]
MNYLFSNRDLKRLILPLIIEQFLQCFVGLADSLMVATVGEAAVSAVSLVDSVFLLLIYVFSALATGGAVVAGQALGRKDNDEACRSANQLVVFIAEASFVIMILVYLGRELMMRLVFGDIELDVLENCRTYLNIVTLSIPFIAVYNAGAALFRSMGNSRVSMITAMLMNAINLIGNAVLIFGFKMGITGVAIPTLISRVVGCVYILKLLKNPEWKVHLPQRLSFKPDGPILKQILRIGVPNGLENGMFHLGKIVILSLVASFGTASIAANAVGNNVTTFAYLPGTAIGYAILTVVSQCVGAKDIPQARYYVKKLVKLTYLVLLISNVLVALITIPVLHFYNLSPEATELAKTIIWYYNICCILIYTPSFPLPNALRAANDVKYTLIVAAFSMWVFRIGFSYVLGDWLEMGLFGVWVAMTIDWAFRGLLFTVRYLRGGWEKKAVPDLAEI